MQSLIADEQYSCWNKKPFFTVPSNPRPFRTKRWKATNAGKDQGTMYTYPYNIALYCILLFLQGVQSYMFDKTADFTKR